jgi:hypothetical protein
MDILNYIDKMQEMYEGKPSSMAQEPRNMANGGQIPFDNGGDVESIAKQTEPLGKKKQLVLFKSYDNIYKQEYKRLLNLGDPFSKSDLSRAIINRIASENPTISLTKGVGLDKIPGGGDERSKTIFENIDKKFTKKELSKFTQGNQINARINTKNQEALFKEVLKGNNNLSSLAKKFKIPEERLGYRIEKLMRNLAKSSGDQYTFLNDFKEKDLEKVRNNIYDSPTLENVYQRTLTQSILQSTTLGSKERKQAFNKLQEFNKFKKVMIDNGLNPKLLAMDHAASYRAIKNGNVKNFLAVTPVMSDINTLKSSFDKRSQLNLRRMQEYLASGDNKKYKYFLKNQTELENLWKTMTGSQSSLGKIRVRASGPQKGKIKITDYGSTSLLDKNKNLLDELANNLDIRKNIVNASSVENLDTARRIMLEGSELTEKKMLGTIKKTDRSAKTIIDQSFENINKPAMFKKEQKIAALLEEFGCGRKAGGRILMRNGGATLTECAIAGQKKLNLGLTNGFDKTEGELAKKILQAGRGLGSAFALRNILGPAAVGFTVAAEAGLVGYDMLATGKSFKEAVGASLFNYALGDKTKIDNKKLRYQGYADAGVSANQIGKISAYENAIDEMNNTFAEFDEENRLYNIAANQKGRGRMDPTRFKKIKQQQAENFYNQADKNKALIQDLARTQTESRLDKALDPMVPALMSDADAKRKAMQLTKPLTVKFGNFMDTAFPKGFLSDTTYKEDRDKAVNYMPKVQEYYRGNRFAKGGLSGGDTSGPPPESGPMSQGLRSLIKNGRKL